MSSFAATIGPFTRVGDEPAPPLDDKTLVRAFLRTGDDELFEELVRRHKARVFHLAAAVLGPGSEPGAEDVCQEVFVLVYRNLTSFRMESELSTWLYRMTTNRAIDRRRRTARTQESLPNDSLSALTLTVLVSVAAVVILPQVALLRFFRTPLFDVVSGTVTGFEPVRHPGAALENAGQHSAASHR